MSPSLFEVNLREFVNNFIFLDIYLGFPIAITWASLHHKSYVSIPELGVKHTIIGVV